jgi:hypothetical protein
LSGGAVAITICAPSHRNFTDDTGVSGKDWRQAGDVMSQLLDAIACGDLRKQDRLSKKLAGILAKRSATNELRESLRRWQDTRRKWVDLRQRAERA